MLTRPISLVNGNMELTRKLVVCAELNKELNKETRGFCSAVTRNFLVKKYRGEQFWDCFVCVFFWCVLFSFFVRFRFVLFACTLACLLACLFVCLFVCLCVCLLACVFVCVFVCLFVCSFVRSFVRLFVCLFVCLFVR